MQLMSPEYSQQLDKLAESLVTPERFGKLLLQDTIEFEPIPQPRLPHTYRIYEE